MSEVLKQLTARWFEDVWNKGRREVIDEMFGADCILHDGSREVVGPESFKQQYDELQGVLSAIHIQPEQMICQGDHVLARWVVRAKHRASGKDIDFTGMTLMRFEECRAVEGWQNWDQHRLMEQVKDVSGDVSARAAGA